MRPGSLVFLLCLSCATAHPAEQTSKLPAELTIFENARVYTLNPERPRAAALAVANGEIIGIYDDPADAPPGPAIDLRGAIVVPGLVDAHGHLEDLGREMLDLDLSATRSAREVAARVRERAEHVPEGGWIIGYGWDQNEWEGKTYPDSNLLDEAAPNHRVWLRRISHAAWVSGNVLREAGIDASTESPKGGEILLGSHGQPTGVLIDNARDLVRPLLPEPSAEETRRAFERAFSKLTSVGLTGVHTMDLRVRDVEVLLTMEAEDAIPMRVYVYVGDSWENIEGFIQNPPDNQGRVQVIGIKLYADGALGSRSAALLEPYSDDPSSRGLSFLETDELRRRVQQIDAAGYQLAIHAIGDAANRQVLDVLAPLPDSSLPRIEHAQILHPEDIPRFAREGVVASVQPIHATSDMAWAVERLGESRLIGAYPWKSLIDTGALVAFGSDFPVESPNPWPGIHAAVTRQTREGEPPKGFLPTQRLTVEEALLRFTVYPARARGAENAGQLTVGAPADFVVLDRDPFEIAARELWRVRPMRTVVGGQTVYPATEAAK